LNTEEDRSLADDILADDILWLEDGSDILVRAVDELRKAEICDHEALTKKQKQT